MTNGNPSTAFSASRKDLDNLKQTAVDAAQDLSSTASVHAAKAKDQLSDLAANAQEEGAEQLNQLRGSFSELLQTAENYVAARPLTCVGIVLAVGVMIGLSRRTSCREE